MPRIQKRNKFWKLVPLFGIIIFIILYFTAVVLYPGGSQADKNSIGFSWVNNYWCNLLQANAINGQTNSAQPVALCGMFILSLALSFFWFTFPSFSNIGKLSRLAIQFFGITAMIVALFLFTKFH